MPKVILDIDDDYWERRKELLEMMVYGPRFLSAFAEEIGIKVIGGIDKGQNEIHIFDYLKEKNDAET